jgi:hypothetical protein
MAMGSTQSLTEMSTRNLPGGKGRPACKADSLTAICEPDCLENVVEPRRLTTLWAATDYYKDSFIFFLTAPDPGFCNVDEGDTCGTKYFIRPLYLS